MWIGRDQIRRAILELNREKYSNRAANPVDLVGVSRCSSGAISVERIDSMLSEESSSRPSYIDLL